MTSSAPIHIPPSLVSFSDGNIVSSGFVPVPRTLFDLVLCQDLGKRELRLFLLILRLTYGCRDSTWAVLRPGDLSTIGIHSSHARLCLRRLLSTGLILRDGDTHRYRAHPKWTPRNSENEVTEMAAQIQQLRGLIGKHLGRSRAGTQGLPAVTADLPTQVQETQKATPQKPDSGIYTDLDLSDADRASMRWRFDRQQHRFQPTEDTSLTGKPS